MQTISEDLDCAKMTNSCSCYCSCGCSCSCPFGERATNDADNRIIAENQTRYNDSNTAIEVM